MARLIDLMNGWERKGGRASGLWRYSGRITLPFLVVGVILFVASCAVGPDYVRPTAPVPESFKEMKGWKVAEPRDEIVRGRWWEIYNDPQLNTLEEQVNISNQNIAIAEANFRLASATVRSAQSLFFPLITTNPSAIRSLRSQSLGLSGSSAPGTNTLYSSPLNMASWELDVWGRIRRLVESARAGAQASAADLEGIRLSIQAAVAQDYFLLRALDRTKQLYDATVAAYERSLELTKNQYESGVASRGDVLQAETLLKTAKAQAIDLGVLRAQAEHAIALLVGKPASNFSIPVLAFDAVPPPVPAGLPSELLERRPDIAAAERRVAAANAQIGVARAAYFPTVTLSGSMGFQSLNSFDWDYPSRFWSFGPMISETLFDGGARGALSDQARAAYDANVANYRQTVLTAFQQVEDNLAALRILEEEARAQDDAVRTSQKSVEYFLNQYRQGTVNYLSVVAAQATALANERTAVNIQNRRMAASVLLIQALGGGWNASALSGTSESTDKPAVQEPAPKAGIPAKQAPSTTGG
jgi:NodT family efflux transporter outer membrane factor (OMF) lipoprotein